MIISINQSKAFDGNSFSFFLGVRSKCYCMDIRENKVIDGQVEEIESTNKAMKGCMPCVQRNTNFEDFHNVILNLGEHLVSQHQIRSINQQVGLKKTRKRAFSSFDDKTHVLSCHHTIPHGHHRLSEKRIRCIYC